MNHVYLIQNIKIKIYVKYYEIKNFLNMTKKTLNNK